MTTQKRQKTCDNGHTFFKSSDCPTCPVCEQERKPTDNLLARLAAPARRALENAGIKTVDDLSKWSEKEIAKLHGMGPSSLPKLKKVLEEKGLTFKA